MTPDPAAHGIALVASWAVFRAHRPGVPIVLSAGEVAILEAWAEAERGMRGRAGRDGRKDRGEDKGDRP